MKSKYCLSLRFMYLRGTSEWLCDYFRGNSTHKCHIPPLAVELSDNLMQLNQHLGQLAIISARPPWRHRALWETDCNWAAGTKICVARIQMRWGGGGANQDKGGGLQQLEMQSSSATRDWSRKLVISISGGGELSRVRRICLPLDVCRKQPLVAGCILLSRVTNIATEV